MATQEQLEALDAAIAAGTLEVRIGDKMLRYNTFGDLVAARNFVRDQLNLQAGNQQSRSSFASFVKD